VFCTSVPASLASFALAVTSMIGSGEGGGTP
jgi:hypothetical protein